MKRVSVAVLSLCTYSTVHAIPIDLTHSGRVLDAQGTPYSGVHNLSFVLRSGSGGLLTTVEYPQHTFEDGYYSVALQDLDSSWFAAEVTVEVLVAGQSLGATPLTAVPYAAVAEGVPGTTATVRDFGTYRAWSDGTVASSCLGYLRSPESGKNYLGATGNGVYRIQPTNASSAVDVYCDMHTDGGGWTLIASFVRAGNTNPPRDTITIPTSPTTGASMRYPADMGMAASDWSQVRFYCTSEGHNRVIHFKTSHVNIRSDGAIDSDYATVANWTDTYTDLPGHTGQLPQITGSAHADAGWANFPFYTGNLAHWAIGGHGTRWECDDWPEGETGDPDIYGTTHHIWVR